MIPKHQATTGRALRFCSAALASIALTSPLAHAQKAYVPTETQGKAAPTALESWWNGKSATANWLGLGYPLQDYGLTIGGSWKGAFYGNVSGGYSNHGAFDEELKFTAIYDFGKVLGLKGLTANGTVRWRDGSNINQWVGAQNGFGPSHWQSGLGWRILPFYLTYETENKAISVSGGWVNPKDFFLQQEGAKLAMNNMLESTRGIGGSNGGGGMPWSSSYATWGGSLKVKPSASTYIIGGLYEAIPNTGGVGTNQYGPYYTLSPLNAPGGNGVPPGQQYQIKHQGVNATSPQRQPRNNHGLYFQGNYAGAPGGNPGGNANGVQIMGEIGWEPKFGPDQLPGKYAFGGYYWGIQTLSYQPLTSPAAPGKHVKYVANDGTYGFYWQFDQMLFREHPHVEAAPVASGGKNVVATNGKTVVAPAPSAPKLSKQGLYSYNLVTWAPQFDNNLCFYVQHGLYYQGLIPTRDDDKLSVHFGYANFSSEQIGSNADAAHYTYATVKTTSGGKTTTTYKRIGKESISAQWGAVLELDYQFQINKWAYVQPFLQYIINPAQNYTVQNATILGVSAGLKF